MRHAQLLFLNSYNDPKADRVSNTILTMDHSLLMIPDYANLQLVLIKITNSQLVLTMMFVEDGYTLSCELYNLTNLHCS